MMTPYLKGVRFYDSLQKYKTKRLNIETGIYTKNNKSKKMRKLILT